MTDDAASAENDAGVLAPRCPHCGWQAIDREDTPENYEAAKADVVAHKTECPASTAENDAGLFLGSVALLNALFETYEQHIGVPEPEGPNGPYMWCACGWRSDDLVNDNPGLSYAVHLVNAQHAAAVKALQPIVRHVLPPALSDEDSCCTCGDPVAGAICHHVFPLRRTTPEGEATCNCIVVRDLVRERYVWMHGFFGDCGHPPTGTPA